MRYFAAILVALALVAGAAVGVAHAQSTPISRLKLAATLPALNSLDVQSTVRFLPLSGIDYWTAIARLVVITPHGPVNMGLPYIVPITYGRQGAVGTVGAACYPYRRRSARSWAVKVTAAGQLLNGRSFSGIRYSLSQQLPC